MAARIPLIMPRFDRDTPHVVLRPFELDGRMLAPGSAFDRSRVTVRLHRLLYEQRKIGPSGYLDPATVLNGSFTHPKTEVQHDSSSELAVSTSGHSADATKMVSEGRCDTTETERFAFQGCACATYAGNKGPCATYEPGVNDRCVYCDHDKACHDGLKSGVNASNEGEKINMPPVRRLETRRVSGRWAVFEGDAKVSKLMTRDQARQLALTMAQCPA